MKLAIIYSKDFPVENLIKSGEEYFDKVLALPVEGLRYSFREENKVMYKDTNLCEFDAAYFRIQDSDLLFMEQVVEILQDNGVYVQMDPDSGVVASDKFLTMAWLRENDISVPDSIYALSPDVAMTATKNLGYPVTVKLLTSYGGRGIMRASGEKELKPIMDTLELLEQSICLQKFIDSESENVRIVVVGDETYSMNFVPEEGEWRASPGIGGKKEKYDASDEVREIGLKAARAVGFDLCDVDILVTEEGAYVVEIDFIQVTDDEACELTGTNLREEIMSFIHEKAVEKEAGLEE